MNRRRVVAGIGTCLAGVTGGCLGDPTYTVSDPTVTDESETLSITVTITEPQVRIDHPATIRFTLRNETDERIEIRTVGITPLGVLTLTRHPDRPGLEQLLWHPEYRRRSSVEVTGYNSVSVSTTPVSTVLDGNATVTTTYELHGEAVRLTGELYVEPFSSSALVSYRRPSGSFVPYDPTVRLRVRRNRLL